MPRLVKLGLVVLFVSLAQGASAKSFRRSHQYSYLSGETYFQYVYQRHTYRHSYDYGYQFPANTYTYPYNNGEYYSPYTYHYLHEFDDK
jgi:hypothetical protein